MKATIIFLFALVPAILIAQAKPDTTVVPDSLAIERSTIENLYEQENRRVGEIDKQMGDLSREREQRIGKMQLLQLMLRDPTLQRPGKPKKVK